MAVGENLTEIVFINIDAMLFIRWFQEKYDQGAVKNCPLIKLFTIFQTLHFRHLIERSSVSDARYKKIRITEKGKKLVEKFDKFIYAHDESLVKGLTDEQIQTFIYCIDTIKSNIQNK